MYIKFDKGVPIFTVNIGTPILQDGCLFSQFDEGVPIFTLNIGTPTLQEGVYFHKRVHIIGRGAYSLDIGSPRVDLCMNNHIYSTLFKIQERKSDRRSREIEQRKESQNTHT